MILSSLFKHIYSYIFILWKNTIHQNLYFFWYFPEKKTSNPEARSIHSFRRRSGVEEGFARGIDGRGEERLLLFFFRRFSLFFPSLVRLSQTFEATLLASLPRYTCRAPPRRGYSKPFISPSLSNLLFLRSLLTFGFSSFLRAKVYVTWIRNLEW